MLLAIDIGNTGIHFGVFDGTKLKGEWRITTTPHKTHDEYGIIIKEFLQIGGLENRKIRGVSLCSVVPILTPAFCEAIQKYFRCKPLVVTHKTVPGLKIHYDPPRDVGPDRMVNAIAVKDLYREPVIVVDFGTAITFDIVSKRGDYLGGIIAPGVMVSVEALFSRAAKLSVVQLTAPRRVIGKNTVSSVQSGVVYGYAAMVDGMVERIRKELKTECRVVATGGQADLIAPHSLTINEIRPYLTLEGLRILYERGKSKKQK